MAWVGKENLYEHSRSNKLTRTVLGASTMLWIKGGGVIHRFKGSPHVRHLMDEASSPMCVEMVESVIHVLRDCTPRLLRCGLLLLNKEVVEMKVLATPTSTVAGMDQHVPDRIHCWDPLTEGDGYYGYPWIVGFAKSIGICSAIEAELWGIYEDLCFAWELSIAKLCLESECVNALRVIKDNDRS
ncbi:hypothetical protein V6N11_054906 [Hibiscus sabdariffa]|uniref:Uncharacterized protein n=1 Tax=Hibiscus sabdariffa TaxID=183260 RepID=A0ABR2P3L2_9ROSI